MPLKHTVVCSFPTMHVNIKEPVRTMGTEKAQRYEKRDPIPKQAPFPKVWISALDIFILLGYGTPLVKILKSATLYSYKLRTFLVPL